LPLLEFVEPAIIGLRDHVIANDGHGAEVDGAACDGMSDQRHGYRV